MSAPCRLSHDHDGGYHCYPQPLRLSDVVATAILYGFIFGSFVVITAAVLLDR